MADRSRLEAGGVLACLETDLQKGPPRTKELRQDYILTP